MDLEIATAKRGYAAEAWEDAEVCGDYQKRRRCAEAAVKEAPAGELNAERVHATIQSLAVQASEAWAKRSADAPVDFGLEVLSQEVAGCLKNPEFSENPSFVPTLVDGLLRVATFSWEGNDLATPWTHLVAGASAAQCLLGLAQFPVYRDLVLRRSLAIGLVTRLGAEMASRSKGATIEAVAAFLPLALQAVALTLEAGDRCQVQSLLRARVVKTLADAAVRVWKADGEGAKQREALVELLRQLDADWWKAAAPLWWSSPQLLRSPAAAGGPC